MADTLESFALGSVVHYVLPAGPTQGEHRPAIVVRVWDAQAGLVDLQVFLDGSNDGRPYTQGTEWAVSVPYSEQKEGRTWHFVEAEEA